MQLLAITHMEQNFFLHFAATKFKCVTDIYMHVQQLCAESNRLRVGRGKKEEQTAGRVVGSLCFICDVAR